MAGKVILKNNTVGDIAVFADALVLARQTLEMDADDFAARKEVIAKNPSIKHYFDTNRITVEQDDLAAEAEAAAKDAEEAAAKAKAEADAKAKEEADAKAKAATEQKAGK